MSGIPEPGRNSVKDLQHPDHGHTNGENHNLIVHMMQNNESEQTFQNKSNAAPPVCTRQKSLNYAGIDGAISQAELYACASLLISKLHILAERRKTFFQSLHKAETVASSALTSLGFFTRRP